MNLSTFHMLIDYLDFSLFQSAYLSLVHSLKNKLSFSYWFIEGLYTFWIQIFVNMCIEDTVSNTLACPFSLLMVFFYQTIAETFLKSSYTFYYLGAFILLTDALLRFFFFSPGRLSHFCCHHWDSGDTNPAHQAGDSKPIKTLSVHFHLYVSILFSQASFLPIEEKMVPLFLHLHFFFFSLPGKDCLSSLKFNFENSDEGLLWLRINLPMQGTQVRSLVKELKYPTCGGATKPARCN